MGWERILVVNADDYGRSPEVNAGVIEAHERGIVTSASVMVRWPAARRALEEAQSNTSLSVGLHVDLGHWECFDGTWHAVYERVATNDRAAVETELRHQLELFRDLAGADPTHLDTHQHVHRDEPVGPIVRQLAVELGVPMREGPPGIRFCGEFYGQTGTGDPFPEGIAPEHLIELIEGLRAGVTELLCHPGRGMPAREVYAAESEREIAVLCDSRVRDAIQREGIALRTFSNLPAGSY